MRSCWPPAPPRRFPTCRASGARCPGPPGVTNLHEIPRRVAVIGGGVVACESSCWPSGLGVDELTVIGSAPSLLGRNEPFAGELVRQAFEDHGVRVELNAKVDRVDRVDPRDTARASCRIWA